MYKKYIKRFIDLVIAIVGLIICSPVLAVFIVLLLITNKGNPFFLQVRPGKNNKLFRIIKFKTMRDEKNENGELLPDKKRLTNMGVFIRKYSIDELPQLINVIKGDMSLIGPRPLLVHYLPLYSTKHKKRHDVRPGITGWAQVNGRNEMLFSKRFDNDVWYVNNISFSLDFKIFRLTIKKAIASEGIVSGQNVMEVDDLGFNKK